MPTETPTPGYVWLGRVVWRLAAVIGAARALAWLTDKAGFAALAAALFAMAIAVILWEKRESLSRWTSGGVVGLLLVTMLSGDFAVVAFRRTMRDTHLKRRSDLVLCPGRTPLCQTVTASLPRDTNVEMLCYEIAYWTDLKKHAWFYIRARESKVEGFSHASPVANQVHTPECKDLAWLAATSWALARDGEVLVTPSDRLDAGMKTWSGWSAAFVYQAYRRGAQQTLRFFKPTAQATFEEYQKNGLVRRPAGTPPRGAMVFFRAGRAGAAAISLGNGYIDMAPPEPMNGRGPVRHLPLAAVGLPQLGYVLPGDLL